MGGTCVIGILLPLASRRQTLPIGLDPLSFEIRLTFMVNKDHISGAQ